MDGKDKNWSICIGRGLTADAALHRYTVHVYIVSCTAEYKPQAPTINGQNGQCEVAFTDNAQESNCPRNEDLNFHLVPSWTDFSQLSQQCDCLAVYSCVQCRQLDSELSPGLAAVAVAAFCLSGPLDPYDFSRVAERLFASWHKEGSIQIWHLIVRNCTI